MVQFEQAVEDFAARGLGEGKSDALLGVVEAVAEIEVLPAISGSDGLVHFDVQVAEFGDVGAGFSGVVEAVVCFGQRFISGLHTGLSVLVIMFANVIESGQRNRKREGLETIAGGIGIASFKGRTVMTTPFFM